MSEQPSYFKYWGKASKADIDEYHLLPYHCLDVAAVGSVWWEGSKKIRDSFCAASKCDLHETKAWILFLLALHDIGKFDIRFQRKVPDIQRRLQRIEASPRLSHADSKNYLHGPAGLYWFGHEFEHNILKKDDETRAVSDDPFDFDWGEEETRDPAWEAWKPLIEAVAGHHGHIIAAENNAISPLPIDCPATYADLDKNARDSWIDALAALFLEPAGVSLLHVPPAAPSVAFLAGFCSVSDWLGSANSRERFNYLQAQMDLSDYFEQRQDDAHKALQIAGLIGRPKPYNGVQALLKERNHPHQVQTVIEDLEDANGLTIIEAPTGSGKTEAALAYAWRLIINDLADGIVFALPTQATANAMLGRLEVLATVLFDAHPNLLLAHGNARYNKTFSELCEIRQTAQDNGDEAWAQCSEWLAQSRKRAFLGQIGVCTVDQVLTSVLPVRHRFIRSLGIGRSILIVDEVHAYDTYMYGLLKAVLEEQKAVGGSAILLSATLPQGQRRELFEAWDKDAALNRMTSGPPPYPLVSQITSKGFIQHRVPENQMPPKRKVWVEPIITEQCAPTEELITRAVQAAQNGAKVVVICNLVDVAIELFDRVSSATTMPAMLFHSRFTLEDRQRIEKSVLECFGPDAKDRQGAILMATQVVEQSLDVDFDWMITQICPVDLLFQRLGRLHRHAHKNRCRPHAFREPRCTVLFPDGPDLGLHGLIYANTRVMWRTIQLIEMLKNAPINFPQAYREWIEKAYQEEAWGWEPSEVERQYQEFLEKHQYGQKLAAQMMLNSTRTMTPLIDDDMKVAAVTRDGQMSLTTVPYVQTSKGRRLINGIVLESLTKDKQPEALAMNKVSVPHTWGDILSKHLRFDDGIYWLAMDRADDHWIAQLGPWELKYNDKKGLERIK